MNDSICHVPLPQEHGRSGSIRFYARGPLLLGAGISYVNMVQDYRYDLAIANAYIFHNVASSSRFNVQSSRKNGQLRTNRRHMRNEAEASPHQQPLGATSCHVKGGRAIYTDGTVPRSAKPNPKFARATRSKDKKLFYDPSRNNQQYKNCVACEQVKGERGKTKYNCKVCQAPVCVDPKFHKNATTGEMIFCWDHLHHDETLVRRFEMKLLR